MDAEAVEGTRGGSPTTDHGQQTTDKTTGD
jgi:hypothetical protein